MAKTMTATNNGTHRANGYFEWWYMHFVTEAGIALNLVLHETDIFGQTQTPYLSLSVFIPGQAPRYYRRPLTAAQILPGDRLRVEPQMIVETTDSIAFDISFAEGAALRGKLTKLAAPLVIEAGLLFGDQQSGRGSYWVPTVPRGALQAILELEGEMFVLSGMGYQDHQWGQLPLQTQVADWVWGHFSNREMALVFFRILTQQGTIIERVGLFDNQQRLTATAVDAEYLVALANLTEIQTASGQQTVTLFDGLACLHFDLQPHKLMRSRVGESLDADNKQVSYLRWATAADYTAGSKCQRLYGITEYMRVRATRYATILNPT